MSNETITLEGVEYISPAECSFGDYGGYGAVGLANIRYVVGEAGEDNVYETNFSDIKQAQSSFNFYPSEESDSLRAVVKSENPPLVLHVKGDYSSETVFIRAGSDLAKNVTESLEQYPSLDDDAASEIENGWEIEAWDIWIRSDLEDLAFPDDEPIGYDTLTDDEKFSLYREAMEAKNEYCIAEYSGVSVNTSLIADAYQEAAIRFLSNR